jgi:hypothetical protein
VPQHWCEAPLEGLIKIDPNRYARLLLLALKAAISQPLPSPGP